MRVFVLHSYMYVRLVSYALARFYCCFSPRFDPGVDLGVRRSHEEAFADRLQPFATATVCTSPLSAFRVILPASA